MPDLTYEALKSAVAGNAAAFRCKTKLEPAGGPDDKVFPPTYKDAVYAEEQRRINGEDVTCVLLDSVQSQANRMEEALQDAIDEGRVKLPVVEVDFDDIPVVAPGSEEEGFYEPIGRVTSYEAPHRVADAILRDSETEEGIAFRKSEHGVKLDMASLRNATPLYEICPSALVFGIWDSTGPKGGLGVKFQRALVSEIVGVDAKKGTRTSSRIDPLAIGKDSAELYEAKEGGWTADESLAVKAKGKAKLLGKDGKPSRANHGNIVPSDKDINGKPLHGGITIKYAEQVTVLSLPALRRLRFPVDGKQSREINQAGQTVLAALGLCGAVLAAERGLDLRSRCLLWSKEELVWEVLERPDKPKRYTITPELAIALLDQAVKEAEAAGLKWLTEPLKLRPQKKLVDLVRKSQEMAVTSSDEG